MEQIRLISTSTVRPENMMFTNHRIELTPCDLQLLLVDPIQKGLLFRKPQNDLNIQHLKSTLSQTLDIFYPLAGRLAMIENDDETKSFYIHCNGAGALLLHTALDGVTVADVLDPAYIPDDIVYSFFPMNGVPNHEGISKPLLAVQVTELVDGVFFACTMNHVVSDGTSFWQFFNTWSEISRTAGGAKGASSRFPPLDFSREFLENMKISLPLPVPFSPDHGKDPDKNNMPSLKQRMFHFSKENIAKLKAKANAEKGTASISSLQAIMAHLFVLITRNRRLKPKEKVTYKVIVGLRPRTDPPMSERYFGNMVHFGSVQTTAGELLENGLGCAAWKMNRMIAFQRTEEVSKSLKDWAENPKMISKVRGVQHLELGNTLITGSSPRFDVFGNDFGWGRPIAVRSGPGNKFDGKLTVFPGAEQGSIDFEVCLATRTLERMESDAEFFKV